MCKAGVDLNLSDYRQKSVEFPPFFLHWCRAVFPAAFNVKISSKEALLAFKNNLFPFSERNKREQKQLKSMVTACGGVNGHASPVNSVQVAANRSRVLPLVASAIVWLATVHRVHSFRPFLDSSSLENTSGSKGYSQHKPLRPCRPFERG